MKIDKQNGKVAYSDAEHVYWNVDDNEKYISVTTLIHSFSNPYDKEFWSAYKALEQLLPKDIWNIEKKSLLNTKKFDKSILEVYNISENEFNKVQQDILDQWFETNRTSCDRGTKIHAELENSFYKRGKDISLQKFGIGGKFECKKDYTDLDLEYGIYPEYLIHRESDDGILRIAGQADLIIKSGNEITILDWKGLPLDTKIPTIDGWSTIKDLKEGDYIFDKDGNPTKIIHKSKVHYNPCYKITFDNGNSIVADCDHRWLIEEDIVMTTEQIFDYLKNNQTKPKILNPKPLNCPKKDLPIDSYSFGMSEIYQRASYEQRIGILRKFMDINGYFDPHLEKFVIAVDQEREKNEMIEFLATFGIKSTVIKKEHSWDICFYTNLLIYPLIHSNKEETFRTIEKVEPVETVPTQCLEVDSPSHTFLCTEEMIVTHNTNKEIKTKGFFNSKTKSASKMKYPLNNLDDVNFYHYTLQLSTYAWMLQKINPNFIIKDLIIVHFDHNNNQTIYHCDYLKKDVEKMLYFYKKQVILDKQKEKRKSIEY